MEALWAIREGLGLGLVCSGGKDMPITGQAPGSKNDRAVTGLMLAVSGTTTPIVHGEGTKERNIRVKKLRHKERMQKAAAEHDLDEDGQLLAEGWKMYRSRQSGKAYFRNSKLDQTQWTHPGNAVEADLDDGGEVPSGPNSNSLLLSIDNNSMLLDDKSVLLEGSCGDMRGAVMGAGGHEVQPLETHRLMIKLATEDDSA
eukprot:CAMPEP_0173413514 /NCGR_PEP_ID=MMETSP1356-20130122/82276_1 /TAXON_ID=77927 ORGANISM="Hemiselmis virescens, Strain PCC157" /NCGR_SAMPLE_ID=MMETSP1356 /ASSEMBLY_ACC=CAM_ASM_000847 /LENGTH=199 /DNA_ID=CAMNT_0014375569 /DNA_START=66 /DNA_END=661 /DNA_ORIENTATION=-